MTDLHPILQAVRQATTLCREVQRIHLVRNEKAGQEPVTIADYGSQAILCRAISRAFQDDAVLAEEQGAQFLALLTDEQRLNITQLLARVLQDTVSESDVVRWLDHGQGLQAERTWVIDPIDGTKGFLAMRHYVIAVGLLVDGKVIGGVIGAPGYPRIEGGALFHALNGKAHVQPINGGDVRLIRVSDQTDVSALRVVESLEFSHSDQGAAARIFHAASIMPPQVERIDSQEKYARVACGDAEVFLRLPRERNPQHRVWDHAAGVALVEASGGIATDIDGSTLDFSQGATLARNKGVVVTNGHMHEHMLAALKEAVGAEWGLV